MEKKKVSGELGLLLRVYVQLVIFLVILKSRPQVCIKREVLGRIVLTRLVPTRRRLRIERPRAVFEQFNIRLG